MHLSFKVNNAPALNNTSVSEGQPNYPKEVTVLSLVEENSDGRYSLTEKIFNSRPVWKHQLKNKIFFFDGKYL